MFISIQQVKAARALLDWTQDDLAAQAGIDVNRLRGFESGRTKPLEVVEAVHEALSRGGILFLDEGVQRQKFQIRVYEGEDCYLRLMDDAFHALSKNKGEFLLSGADERRSTQEVTERTRAMRKAGIQMRFLVKDQNTFLMGPLEEYRWLNDELYVDGDVKVIFGDTIAYLMTWQKTPRVVILDDKIIAEENRRTFNYLWRLSSKPTHSTATAFYDEG